MEKFRYYSKTKDKVSEYLKSHIMYEFCCLACYNEYIGKMDQNFGSRVEERSG